MSAVLVVGTLNRPASYFAAANGTGLVVLRVDPETCELSEAHATTGCIDNPSYLCVSPDGRHIYAGSEVEGWKEGLASAYRLEAGSGRLTYLNKQPTLGSITAHLSLDRTGRFLLVANYRMGDPADLPGQALAVLPLAADGSLRPACASAALTGSGPDPVRQEQPHAHCVLPSPDNRILLLADLGADRVLSYRFDAATGTLDPEPASSLSLPHGSGPRHLLWDASGRRAYLTLELTSRLAVLDYEPATGRLSLAQTVPALPDGVPGASTASDLQFGPGGRFLYSANRGHDSIAMFAVSADDGRLAPLGHVPAGGRTPRNLAVDPAQRFLLAACQDDDLISRFAIDPVTGGLAPLAPFAIGTPLCMKFAG